MKKLAILFLILLGCRVYSMDKLDLSVDEEIRKKYNVDEISLPPVPKVEYNGSSEVEIEQRIPVKELANKDNSIIIKKGTKVKLKSLNQISDKTREGSKVSFSLLKPVTTKYLTLPANTTFYGKIIKSHTPQVTGNGGLIAIHLNSVKFNGESYSLNGRVLKADEKHIFLNNIKGKRKYMVSLPKSITWGKKSKNKMYKLTKKYSKKKSTWIACPFTFTFGTLAYTSNVLLAPIIALKYKGEGIILNKGTEFVFKLTEDLYIY